MSKFKRQDYEPTIKPPCAHSGCASLSDLVRKLPTGWAFLCKAHDLFHVQLEADEFCRANGLTSRAKQVEFIRARKSLKHSGREPGQDDEEIAA